MEELQNNEENHLKYGQNSNRISSWYKSTKHQALYER